MNEVINLIGNVAFPIVAFLLMWKQCNESTKMFSELNQAHIKETSEIRNALENNTDAIRELRSILVKED